MHRRPDALVLCPDSLRVRSATGSAYPQVWHIITGEYPPQHGGVSDYSRLIANGLVDRGDTVHVYAPPSSAGELSEPGINIHRLPGHFDPRSLRALGRALHDHPEDVVLVQYVPHAYGYKAMNVFFCLWLNRLRRTHRRINVMFHEVSMPFRRGQPMSHRLQAIVTSPMAILVARAARTIFVSIPAWKDRLTRFGVRKAMTWLPVPSNIRVADDPGAVTLLRRSLGAATIVGHFGTCADAIGDALKSCVPPLLEAIPDVCFMLIGREGMALKESMTSTAPHLAERIHATGELAARGISIALSACDLMLQPYPDGISSRRTGVMAALAHQRAVVTTIGKSTEPVWSEAGAAAMVPNGNNGLLYEAAGRLSADRGERNRFAEAGKRLYEERFALRHTLDAMQRIACA